MQKIHFTVQPAVVYFNILLAVAIAISSFLLVKKKHLTGCNCGNHVNDKISVALNGVFVAVCSFNMVITIGGFQPFPKESNDKEIFAIVKI